MSRWSSHKTMRARRMYESGNLSVAMIAASLRVDPVALIAKARAGGWSKPKPKTKPVKPPPVETPKGRAAQGRRSYPKAPAKVLKPAGRHHFNGFHGSNAVVTDARNYVYSPDLLSAIKTLQRADFVVYRIKPDLFMCGTSRVTEAALREKAARYERRAA